MLDRFLPPLAFEKVGQWGLSFSWHRLCISKTTGWGGHRVHPPGPPPSAFVNDVSMGVPFLLASDLQLEKVDFESLENRGFSTMGLPCKQCEKSLPVDDIFEFLYCDEGIYFFCSKECSDKWMSVNAQEIGPEILQQTSI